MAAQFLGWHRNPTFTFKFPCNSIPPVPVPIPIPIPIPTQLSFRFHSSAHKLISTSSSSLSCSKLNNTRFNIHPKSSPFLCQIKPSDSDMISQLELGKPERRRPVKQVNGIFWILLLNIGIFVADHLLQVQGVKALYLYHNWPTWYQFVTATFCHANWNHLSSNLFFLYIFGKLVEEEEGNFGLWLSYILTGAGANLVSWLILPRNAVSVGASGAVFGLFAISVLVKMSWDWRKILEVLILGQFVIERVHKLMAESPDILFEERAFLGNPLKASAQEKVRLYNDVEPLSNIDKHEVVHEKTQKRIQSLETAVKKTPISSSQTDNKIVKL